MGDSNLCNSCGFVGIRRVFWSAQKRWNLHYSVHTSLDCRENESGKHIYERIAGLFQRDDETTVNIYGGVGDDHESNLDGNSGADEPVNRWNGHGSNSNCSGSLQRKHGPGYIDGGGDKLIGRVSDGRRSHNFRGEAERAHKPCYRNRNFHIPNLLDRDKRCRRRRIALRWS